MQYKVRKTKLKAAYLAFDLDLAMGTSPAANDVAVLDILNAAMDLELAPKELGAYRDDDGRVTVLDWHDNHPYEYVGPGHDPCPARGIHPPDVRLAWELPSELGQLARLALWRPLLTGTIPPELGQLEQLTLVGSHLTGAVPPELGQMAQLYDLGLTGKRLTSPPLIRWATTATGGSTNRLSLGGTFSLVSTLPLS